MTENRQVDLNDPSLPDAQVEMEIDETRPGDAPDTPCKFITGIAGSGKTYQVRAEAEADPASVLLTATTGIAAVNLGTVTFWSALGLHPDSIEDQFTSGHMRARMHAIARTHRSLGIDESSMLSGLVLEMLYQSAQQVNEYVDVKAPFGLTLIGDLCQLPPIKAPWIFEAPCWPEFEAATVRLTTNWRQGAGRFLDALNHLRRGAGRDGAMLLNGLAHWERSLNPSFDGTVILGKNKQVDNYNWLRFTKHRGEQVSYRSRRWGKQRSEWENIPEQLHMKDGAYVMVLSNDTERDADGRPMFRWVNGDCGHVTECGPNAVEVKLNRTGESHYIGAVTREVLTRDAPEFDEATCERAKESLTKLPDGSYWDRKKRKWVRGGITYMPLRLAYATTVHKSQGLSLTGPVMVDLREPFLGEPSMVYVALSRATRGENLHLVGNSDVLIRRCNIDPKVAQWL